MDAIKEGMLASAKAAEAAARIGERLFCQNTPICYLKQSSVIHEDTKKIRERDRIHDKVYDLNMQMCDIGKIRKL